MQYAAFPTALAAAEWNELTLKKNEMIWASEKARAAK